MAKCLPVMVAVGWTIAATAGAQDTFSWPPAAYPVPETQPAAFGFPSATSKAPIPLPPVDSEVQLTHDPTVFPAAAIVPEAIPRGPFLEDVVPPPLIVQEIPPAAIVAEEVPPPVKLWEGSLELGLNGTEGNSQTFNFRFGAKLKRKTDWNIFSADADYRQDTADSRQTANRAFLDSRYEHLFGDSPWNWFVHGTVEYDEFQAFDLRVAMDSGLGYRFLKNDTTTLLGRFGAGTSREIGGPDDEFVPEAVFGAEFEHQISLRQKLCLSAEYRPDVTDWADYRFNSKAGWEILLDEVMNLSMKITVSDRYDSTPHDKKANDLDYAVTLLWSF